EWTQAGLLDGIGFAVETRTASSDGEWELATEFLPGMLQAENSAHFVTDLIDQVPGRFVSIRIVAIRHALDPIDPCSKLRTRIFSERSNEITACAIGELRPPTNFVAQKIARRTVKLSWKNRDLYDWIEIRRVGPNSFDRLKCLGTDERFIDVVDDASDSEA